ncbi:OmpA family protein [Flammeovirga sp. EKP202]|uniref:OmpA family protein n=1 Tax=Flammeovirga sp. EKP202 TaxID=2770592 RepID=UPI00165F833F|nr:OmpA family protein [Flammeovirga sp. EKP202]MBD0404453.1 PD40 domain-containing protein [Flammeovirga sp. EKP202]
MTKTFFPKKTKALNIAKQNFKIGENWLNGYNNLDSAIHYFEKVNDFCPNISNVNYQLGYCYLQKENLIVADSFATKAYQLKITLPTLYLNARVNHYLENAEKALFFYQKYIDEYASPASPDKKHIEKLMKQANALLQSESAKYQIDNRESLNSSYDDFSPLFIPNTTQLYFSSNRKSLSSIHEESTNIYYSFFEEDHFQESKILNDRSINIKGNSGISSISKSGKTMVIYHGFGVGRLYYAKINLDKEVKFPENKKKLPSPINNYFYQVIGGTFTPDGKAFYFSSKRKDGTFNLYYTIRNGKKWVEPILVENINSKGNEIDPYFSANGDTLYFSSDGPKSIGGYDIFYARKKGENSWSKPEGLPRPINSAYDEKTPSTNDDGSLILFSSNRPNGKGGFDIYTCSYQMIRSKVITKNNSTESEKPQTAILDAILDENLLNTQLHILSKKDSSQLSDAHITIYTFPENNVLRKIKTGEKGIAQINAVPNEHTFGINIVKKGYELFSQKVYVDSLQKDYTIYLDPIELNHNIALENIFFDTNSSKINKTSFNELANILRFLKVNANVVIQIEGYTDNTGDYDINMMLSQKRADAIVNYLIEAGISKERLVSKGFGEEHPIADNTTSEGKAKNRRTEFKVIKN